MQSADDRNSYRPHFASTCLRLHKEGIRQSRNLRGVLESLCLLFLAVLAGLDDLVQRGGGGFSFNGGKGLVVLLLFCGEVEDRVRGIRGRP